MKNFFNVIKKGERFFIDITDLKLICSDKIIRSNIKTNFTCILTILDSINNTIRPEDPSFELDDDELRTIDFDSETIDKIFKDYEEKKQNG